MFKITLSPEIASRSQFGTLCNKYEFVEAAEIGVDRGGFAVEFLQTWRGFTLLLIDAFEPYEGMPWPRDMDKATALARMLPFADRVRFIQWRSPEAAERLHADWHLHFVYIDAAHDYLSVRLDVEAWYARLDDGGMLAGHDWVTDPEPNGVVRAVTEFARRHDLEVFTTCEGGTPPSWYVFKPKVMS